MILEQLYLGCLSQASYLVGDESAGLAAVVDPRRDIDEYIELAAVRGVDIRHVILTHFHADFVSGHLELQERTGATIHLGPGAAADYAFETFGDGDAIELGDVRLKALSTPGHTPESICILVYEHTRDDEPHAVLTGDTLFIGDAGRPDLMASVGMTADELANMMYDSLHHKLMALPDPTLVYPGHGAGSMCGKNLSTDTVSTIGEQRNDNCALQPMSREDFVTMLTANQPTAPRYFARSADLNRRQRTTLDAATKTATRALELDDVLRLQADGAQVLDARTPDEFAAEHLRGSTNIGLGGRYATWCGTLLAPEREIVLVANPGDEDEAIMRLGRIGFDHVTGFLDGGPAAWDDRTDLTTSAGRLEAAAFRKELTHRPPPFLLDVRAPGEVERGAIESHVNIPLSELEDRCDEVPRDRDVLVYCAGGYRSTIAMSMLLATGHERVRDLIGGFGAWQRQ